MRPHFFLLLMTICFFSCRKEPSAKYPAESITLVRTATSDMIRYSWNLVHVEDFVRYELYGSSSEIAGPDTTGKIDAHLLFSSTHYKDTAFVDQFLKTKTHKFYRVFCRMAQSILASQNIDNASIDFVALPSYQPAFDGVLAIPNQTKILIINNDAGGTFGTIYDYEKKEFSVPKTKLEGYSVNWFKFGVYQNQPVLFTNYRATINDNWRIIIYDLNNLQSIFETTLPTDQYFDNLYLKNNYLVTRTIYTQTSFLISYNLQTGHADSILLGPRYIINRTINPSFLNLYESKSDTLLRYNINPDGSMDFAYEVLIVNGNSFDIPGGVTNGPNEYMVSAGQYLVYDRDLRIIENFQETVDATNPYFALASFDANYFIFHNSGTTALDNLQVYKRGQNGIYKFIEFQIGTNFRLCTNDQIILVRATQNNGKIGLEFIRYDL